jgi:hypothetical protein
MHIGHGDQMMIGNAAAAVTPKIYRHEKRGAWGPKLQ